MKKRICLSIVFLTAALLCSSCGAQRDFRDDTGARWFREAVKYKGAALQEQMAEIDAEKLRLKEKLGDSSLYPQFFAGVKMASLTGKKKKEAVEAVKRWNIERAALAWYAAEQGFSISKEDAEKRLDKRLSEIQEAEEYPEIESKYKEEGLSLAESVKADFRMYWQNFMIEDLAADRYERYTRGELTQEEELSWDKYWSGFQKRVIRKYEKTERCEAQKAALRACEKLYPAEETEIQELSQKIKDTEWEIAVK